MSAFNNRRSSLGTLSQATLNSRQSIAPPSLSNSGRQSIGGPKIANNLPFENPTSSKPQSRMSIGGNALSSSLGASGTNRRQSMGVSNPAPSRKPNVPSRMSIGGNSRLTTDPRNTSDRQFLQNSLKTLITYLSEHGYEYSISPKILSKPSNKDFTNIITFLFGQIDPSFTSTGKLEDDVTAWFKMLGYPFQIAKSNISAVGSPHAWNSMLACLMWLIDLLNYDEAFVSGQLIDYGDMTDVDYDINDSDSSNKMFYKYLSYAYKAFLCGDDVRYNQLQEQFSKQFDSANVLIKDQISYYEAANRGLESEIGEFEKRKQEIPELEGRRSSYHKDEVKFVQLIEQLAKHKEQYQIKVETRKEEVDKLDNAINQLQQDITTLQQRVAAQELTPQDVQRMLSDRQKILDATQTATEVKQAINKKCWEAEEILRGKLEKLMETAAAYNSFAKEYKLVPMNAKHSRGLNLHMEVDPKSRNPEQLLSENVRRDILPILEEYHQDVVSVVHTCRQQLVNERDTYEDLEQAGNERAKQQQDMEIKLRRLEEQYQHKKSSLDRAVSLHNGELHELELKLAQLRDISAEEARYTSAIRRIKELSTQRDANKKHHSQVKEELLQSILDTVTLAANHREIVQSTIGRVQERYAQSLQTLLTNNAPKSSTSVFTAPSNFTRPSIVFPPPAPVSAGASTAMDNLTCHYEDMSICDDDESYAYPQQPHFRPIVSERDTNMFNKMINECALRDNKLLSESECL